MIIEDIIDYTENANLLVERLRNQETVTERKDRENEFIARFSNYIVNMAIVEAMIKVMPIAVKSTEYDALEKALNSGQRVYKNLQISNTVPVNNIQDAVDTLEKIKNRWRKQYLASDRVKETISMLELIMPIYKGTPKPKDLIDDIQAIESDIHNAESVYAAENSVDLGMKLFNTMEIDDDVKTFLKKVSTNSASLLDVNENILIWLKNNNLLSKMKISSM